MSRITQPQVGSIRWYTGLFALGLFVFINLQPAFVATAIRLAASHGHEHQIVVRADGNHLDVRLSHSDVPATTSHDHEPLLPFVAALFSAHDHEGNEHVLHFSTGEVPDQIRSGKVIFPARLQQWAMPTTDLIFTPSVTAKAATECTIRPPPSVMAGLLCLRTTVLLI
jgi:hypothetical protein